MLKSEKVASTNGLRKTSAVDALQLRGVDIQRFVSHLGHLPQITMEEITIAITAVTEYQEPTRR